MTNTYFAPGDATPEDLIAGVERGLYAVSFGGGQVEPATGDFVFGVSEGYLIEGGKVTAPVRGATLVGNGLEALRRSTGSPPTSTIATGYCGKAGQSVPAGVGQPHVRIRELTVGGTGVRRRAGGPRARARSRRRWRRARATPRPGARRPQPPDPRLRRRRREPHRRRRARHRRARLRRRPRGLRVRHRPLRRGPRRARRGARSRRPRSPTRTSTAGLPDELGTTAVDGLASPELADWTTERKVELALAVDAPRAPARA